MDTLNDYLAFVVAILVFLAIPGPGNLALLTSTAKGGVRGGLAATLGVIAGDQVLMWSAVAGLSAVLLTTPWLYVWVQWSGAAYLAWLGWRMIRAQPGDAPVLQLQAGHYFRQALVITLLNPKAIVFYLAFFPLFVRQDHPHIQLVFVVMAVTIAVLTFLYGLVVTLLAHRFSTRMRENTRLTLWLNRVAGVLMLGFGLRLALSR
jgi:threonine/homoserine/homoserine lactone efflux protein